MATSCLDANVLLRLILQDVPEQYERAKRLISSVPDTFVVSHAALNEAVFALQNHYGLARTQIVAMVKWVLTLPTIVGDYDTVLAALDAYATHPQLSYTDCYLAEEAARLAVPLWTFDKKLARQHPSAQEVPDNGV